MRLERRRSSAGCYRAAAAAACLLLAACSNAQSYDFDNSVDDSDRFQEFIATEEERGLFPNIFNLATNSLIKSTATCGQARREEYCKLVEHVLLRKTTNLLDSPQCDICDANDVRHRHPIEFAIDGTKKWWQSPTLYNGLENEKINITIDLRQEYQVAYVVIKMGNSPRPGTWVLEKSLDGDNWEPWQYYAIHDAECMRQFGIPATTGVPRFTSDDEVICTSEYSKLQPLEAGEIHTSLVNGRPGVEKPSEPLQKFTRTRYVRMRLLSLRTLNADLMIINQRSHHLDRSVTMRYFYSISDISIGGQCICYGHAESCPPDPITGQFKCDCRHNTCGESCNKCCPLFNQLPWKQGTNYQPNICQQCQCFNHADRCEYDEEIALNNWSVTPEGVYEGGGRCVECKHNTAGINCEKCADGFYRPSGISHYREDACRPCDCDSVGSLHASCIRDDQSARDGLHPGDCVCKPGFGGRRCERCARGYRNYPKCEPCPCNKHGSVNFDTCEEDSCVCKQNVEGLYCDRCKAGTIHLSEENPLGCQSCFCFGLSSNCTEQSFITGKIAANLGWNLTDRFGAREERPETENGEQLLFNANHNKNGQLYYWKAPANFTGNLLNSYGGQLHYYVYFVPATNERGDPVPLPDLVIEGNGVKLEYYTRQDFFPRENMTVTIPIREGANWYNAETRRPISKDDLMRALADVKLFMVRSMYNLKQLQSSISGLQLDTAVLLSKDEVKYEQDNEDALHPAPVDMRMRGVEVCSCPDNYGGRSCESCISGYRRVGNQLHGGQCVKCECEGHSDRCDPWTGACLDCKHNTTGARCEQCAPGHYGNPSLGGELGTCRPCDCNGHSAECALTQLVIAGSAAAGADAYVCTACEQGYEGNKCEMCADGYFGDATNGTCTECACNGNIDLADIGNCDRKTGKCLKCIGHTTGDQCEKCEENHYGSALAHTCKTCGCHRVGAKSQQCDVDNGICECKENYIGQQCDRCAEGHGDVENECPSCECDEKGSIGRDCHGVSGQCTCKQGVFGKRCDQCRPGYYNFTDAGCQFCHCNAAGSKEEGTCDSATGKCACRDHVDGNMCEKCEDGFFNITSGTGCQECKCDKVGAEGVHCDMHSGQCVCKPGVTGVKCDQCAPNHFGLAKTGCKECPACPAPGQVCDAKTGECVCPPNTVGEMCEACTEDAWDYHPLRGCRKCDCNKQGATGTTCDPLTGQCVCKEQYVGLACDHCSHGHFNFPTCEPCDCAVDGTEDRECRDGICLCDENGQCPCKKNVEGLKCDQCKPNTFSLDATNTLGCTDCFCFNRTDMCVQSPLVWQQIYAEDRVATFAEPWEYYTKKHNLNILKESPARFNSYPTDATPLYWPLHKSMLGDRTGSYNGFLRFKIWNDDNRRAIAGVRPDGQYFRYFPQVVLIGNNRMELEHIPWQINDDGKYRVRLHESEWRSRTAPEQFLTRAQLMIALQQVQGIYIRGTYNYPARGDVITISEISLDVAVPESTSAVSAVAAAGNAASPALGVEQCAACPPGYAGASCQNPAPGFCRKRHRDFLNSADDMALIGWSEPCACNGHSTTCDAETCLCMDCQHNTHGDWCERCKIGYIGEAENGGPASCTKCACPSADHSFSDTCKPANTGRGYVCDACKHGYGGEYCEKCLTGYYGNPQLPGGECKPCECHRDGSLHGACDPISGQCECRPGVTGRDCSRCQERHAFISGVCTSCDQGCYLPLMSMLDVLEDNLAMQNFSGLRPIPWKRLGRIQNDTSFLSTFVTGLVLPTGEITDASGNALDLTTGNQFTKEADTVVDEARFDAERVNKSAAQILALTNKTEATLAAVQQTFRDAHNTTQFLSHYAKHGGEKEAHADMVDVWRAEAEALHNATVERGEYIEKRFSRAEDEQTYVDDLLKRVLANKLNDTSFENLNQRIGEFAQWLDDYRETLHLGAKKDIADAVRMSEVVRKASQRYQDVAAELDSMRGDADDSLAAAVDAIEQTRKKALLNMFDDYRAMNESGPALTKAAAECDEVSNKYHQLLDEYDDQFVQPAVAHSHDLEAEAARTTAAFAATKQSAASPIAAASVYDEIKGALNNATLAAGEAEKAAAEALKESDASIEGTLPAQVVTSLEASGTLSEDAKTLGEEWAVSALPKENMETEELLAKSRSAITAATNSKNAAKDEWTKFDDYHDRVVGLRESSLNADERSSAARKQGAKLAETAANIAQRADKLMNSTGSGIRDEINKMKEVRASLASKMTVAAKQLGGDSETSAERQKRLDEFKDKIALLKDRLGEAREKAEQIRIALHGSESGKCRRSFPSPSSPSPASSIQLRFRPLRAVPDSLLLLTKTTAKRTLPSEYIALELVAQRVVAHWNIGAGQKRVTNSYPINYIPSSADRNTWYTISLERAGNAVNLTVSLREGAAGTPPPVTVTLPKGDEDGDDVIFNTVPGDTQVSIGAEPAVISGLGLTSNEFRGTIGSVTIDGVPMSLWTFSYTTKECGGDTAPSRPAVRGHMFRNGFASMRTLVPQERTTTSITVTFAAFSPNGLLYFRGSQSAGDFVALHIRDGRVVFTINLGSGTSATIESSGTYDDGLQHTVKAVRGPDGVYLQVDSDDDRQQTVLQGGEATALNIDHDEHFVGGVPADFDKAPFDSFDIAWKGYFGCILSVKPNQVTELDIENAHRSFRKEPGCMFSAPMTGSSEKLVPSDRVVGFGKPGFLITQGVTIDGNTNFGFGFRTKEENGTLLFQSSKLVAFRRKQKREDGANGQGYLAFYLFRGFLVCHFGKDASRRDGVVTLRSASPYNDGMHHSVFFDRSGGHVRVRVDDREIGSLEMPDSSPIGRPGLQLFVGGFPERTKPPNDEIPTAVPLIGCISDLSVNFRPIQMVPEDHEANLGSCPMQSAAPLPIGEEIAHPESESTSFARQAKKLSLVMDKNVEVKDVEELYYEVDNTQNEEKEKKPQSNDCGGGFSAAHFDGENGDSMRYGIGQSSHGKIIFDKEHRPNITDFTLSLSFRTQSSDGLLWVWANYKSFSRYFFLYVKEGLLQLDVKGHRGVKEVTLKERRVDDGQWHDVKIIRKEKSIDIQMDGEIAGRMNEAPAPKVMRKRMYIGGVISKHRKDNKIPKGFNGCIRSVVMNGDRKKFSEGNSKDLVPCAPATTKALYSHEGGFASFDSSKTRKGIYPTEELSVQLDFRNMQEDGLVFAVLSPNSVNDKRLTAIMKGGQIYISLVYTAEGIDLREVPIDREAGELCNGKWHRLTVTVEATRLIVAIDEQSSEIPLVISAAARKSLAGLSLYVSGTPSEVASELSVFSLVGCYSDLRFGDKTLYFEEASKVNRAIVDGCPFGRETSMMIP